MLMVNLYIALLTETFYKVYTNAKAHASREQANTILNVEKLLSKNIKKKSDEFIQDYCGPLVGFYFFKIFQNIIIFKVSHKFLEFFPGTSQTWQISANGSLLGQISVSKICLRQMNWQERLTGTNILSYLWPKHSRKLTMAFKSTKMPQGQFSHGTAKKDWFITGTHTVSVEQNVSFINTM